MNTKTFNANQNNGISACASGGKKPGMGPDHPPKNSSVATQATVNMLVYSAIKNMANFMALYSV